MLIEWGFMACDMIINQSRLHFVVSSSCACGAGHDVVQWLCHCWQTLLRCALNDLAVLLKPVCTQPEVWITVKPPIPLPASSVAMEKLDSQSHHPSGHTEKWGEKERARERCRGHPSSRHESGRWPRKVTYSPRYHHTWGPCYGLNGMPLTSVEIHHEIWFPKGMLLRFGGASPLWGI